MMAAFDRLVIHHSASPRSQTFEAIRTYHLSRGWRDIGYHWVIEGTGRLRVGRPIPELGAHARGLNATSLGVCVVGNNLDVAETWSVEQIHTLRRLVDAVRLLVPTIHVMGHGRAPQQHTDCPGIAEPVLQAMLGLQSPLQG